MRSRLATLVMGLLLLPVLSGCNTRTDAEGLARESTVDTAGDQHAETTMPVPRDGADLIGAALPSGLERGLDASGNAPRVTLYRWWTDKCPFCVASLPAIEELRLAFADRGLETIAVFHPKPPIRSGEIPLASIREAAAARGYHGRVATDLDWNLLRELWLDSGTRRATSASFLCDQNGIVRFVHPGPELHRSADTQHELCDADYRALEQAIETLLAE